MAIRQQCEEGSRLDCEQKKLDKERVQAEGEIRIGTGPYAERVKRLRETKAAYDTAKSAYLNHLVACSQCREAKQ